MQIEEMSVWPGQGAAQHGVVAQNNQAAATHYTIHWAAARRQFPAPDPSWKRIFHKHEKGPY